MNKKTYWRSFGELNQTDNFQQDVLTKEFNEDMMIAELNKEAVEKPGTSRRDFLKYLGFATTTAVIASSCETAVKKTIPFLNKPENIIPGEASYYVTTFNVDGEVVPILAKVRDGRPIKIEGNDLCSINKGATSARVQASVLGLYDTARLRYPLSAFNNDKKHQKIEDINAADTQISQNLQAQKGKIALVTNTVNSPSSKRVIQSFVEKYNATHVEYDAVSYSGILEANQRTFGAASIPSYHFDKAQIIVSFSADFLGTWLSPTEFAKQWATNRKLNTKNLNLSKHIQIESLMSLTGANADERVIIKPSEEQHAIALLYAYLSNNTISSPLKKDVQDKIKRIADILNQNKNKALVVAGTNNTDAQVLINGINQLVGAYTSTIDWATPYTTRNGIDNNIAQFVNDLKAKKYDTVIFAHGANPVYDTPQGEDIKNALNAVTHTISLNTHFDETAQQCHTIFPDHHYLESWGDNQIKSGYYTFTQPTINPLFQTRNWQASLLMWSGNNTSYQDYVRQYWVDKLGSSSQFDKALQDGIYVDQNQQKNKANFSSTVLNTAFQNATNTKPLADNQAEVVFYQKVGIGSGSMANNPWLQELPDPITKATWDNYAVISLHMAKQLNIVVDDNYEVEVDKPVIQLTINQKKLELPVLVIPGTQSQTIGIALGYGRTEKIGKTVAGVGKSAYPYLPITNQNVAYSAPAQNIQKLDFTYPLAYTQTHNSYEGREEVMKEFTLEEFLKNPNAIIEERDAEFKKYKNNVIDHSTYTEKATLYGHHESLGIKWGMSIDLNSCTGCGACVVACNSENNISVVGKKQVLKAHEMHWMRIDRYFSGNPENPEVVFQPMLCQHCDNAPCENVCPVAATNHSTEGINQMTYNRCIGTRYCANNCPFKVRRFNWLDYNGADSFPDNQQPLVDEGGLDPVVMDMNDDLTRMVLNPDVTVRSRGVIEKCSFCIQRLQAAKISAKKQNRPVQDGEAKTACMQVCPSEAIVFGNVNDKQSQLYKLRNEDQKQRVFYVLEQIHVLPNVNYLAKVRNKTDHA